MSGCCGPVVSRRAMRRLHAPYRFYRTATVKPACVDASPIFTTTGWLPDGTLGGITRFTCRTPATKPGAAPAYNTSAATPPAVAVTVLVGRGNGGAVTLPSSTLGLVLPSPVPNRITALPLAAALEEPFTEKSPFRIAPCPVPLEFAENSPGAFRTTGI